MQPTKEHFPQLQTQHPDFAKQFAQAMGVWFNYGALACLLLAVLATAVLLGGINPYGTLALRVGTLGSLLLSLTAYAFGQGFRLPSWPQLAAFAALWAGILLGGLPNPDFSFLQEALNWACYGCMFFLTVNLLRSQAQVRVALAIIALLILTMTVYGLMQILGQEFTERLRPHKIRTISSFYFNQAHYGGLMVLLLPLAWSLGLFSKQGWLRLFWVALSALIALNLLFTSSWDAFPFAYIGIAVVSLIWAFHSRRVLAIIAVVLLIAAIPSAIYVAATKTPEQLTKLIGTNPAKLVPYFKHVVDGRIIIQSAALKTALASGWKGVGLGHFVNHATLYRPENAIGVNSIGHKYMNYAHSDYLQMLSETGALGLIGWLGFLLIGIFSKTRLEIGLSLGITAGILALLLHGISDGNFTIIPATVLIGWFLLGLRSARLDPKASEVKVAPG